jgi:Sulfotransferase family
MMQKDTNVQYVVAVGGIGGSGTGVVAAFLDMIGYYLGDDLNEAMDNLWFALLFKRRSILLESDPDFRALMSLFFSRMSGTATVTEQERALVFRLAGRERVQHPTGWLVERAASFCSGKTSKRLDQPWGWKEPNTHIVVDRMLRLHSGLRYIHVVRHPVDMALSANQNQLQNWGPILLSRDITVEPRSSLSYWCAAHRRIAGFMRNWPERTMTVDFDALCQAPDSQCELIAKFLGAQLPDDALHNFRNFIRVPLTVGRFKSVDMRQFESADLAYVTEIGYPL